jgi:AbrB family looped-hinge helix DNA binding protein
MEGDGKKKFSWDDHFFGSVTVGERGQVVIPAEARKRFQIEPGDKLLMMSTPDEKSLMLCRIDSLREFMNAFQEGLTRIEQSMADNTAPSSFEEEDTSK